MDMYVSARRRRKCRTPETRSSFKTKDSTATVISMHVICCTLHSYSAGAQQGLKCGSGRRQIALDVFLGDDNELSSRDGKRN